MIVSLWLPPSLIANLYNYHSWGSNTNISHGFIDLGGKKTEVSAIVLKRKREIYGRNAVHKEKEDESLTHSLSTFLSAASRAFVLLDALCFGWCYLHTLAMVPTLTHIAADPELVVCVVPSTASAERVSMLVVFVFIALFHQFRCALRLPFDWSLHQTNTLKIYKPLGLLWAGTIKLIWYLDAVFGFASKIQAWFIFSGLPTSHDFKESREIVDETE